MTKAAALKKVDAKKFQAKAKATKKPQLKVVKSAPVKAKKAAPKATVNKVVKPAVKQTAVQKPVAKLVAKKPLDQKPVVKSVAVKPAAVKLPPYTVEAKKAPVAPAPVVKTGKKEEFKVGHHVVYPTHGVGKIVAEETQNIAGISLRLLVIGFEKDKMTLRVPVHRAEAAGLRHISGNNQMQQVFITLKGRARISRGMWSRRAQEYEGKINSGSIISVAEVVRDLHQNVDQAERSYSERMIYESALSRLVGELAASEAVDHKAATDKLMKLLRAKIAA